MGNGFWVSGHMTLNESVATQGGEMRNVLGISVTLFQRPCDPGSLLVVKVPGITVKSIFQLPTL